MPVLDGSIVQVQFSGCCPACTCVLRASAAGPPVPRPRRPFLPLTGSPAVHGVRPFQPGCARSAAGRRTQARPHSAHRRSTRAAPGSAGSRRKGEWSRWCARRRRAAPRETHSQAGRLSATRASRQPVPATDQSTEPPAPCVPRSQPIVTTAATASAIAAAATGPAKRQGSAT